jgi:ribosomal protein L11 methyltransferase
MNYIEVDFKITPNTSEYREIIAAMLGQIEFESFSDTKQGIKAYIPENLFDENKMIDILSTIMPLFDDFSFSYSKIEQQNWNEKWEKNFDPIIINKDCRIRAPFHSADKNYKFEIIIEPKMSFGTGHHDTTALMMLLMYNIDFTNKNVLDMGCGTGVLGIFASIKNANKITAIDIDEWACENTIENADKNNVSNITVKQGDISLLNNEKFDIILANINRNILINDMNKYIASLKKEGSILFSGFYTQDLSVIKEKAEQSGLTEALYIEKNNWIAVKFIKS